jgi:hypothetical protein
VLVGAADVGRDDLEDDAVLALAADVSLVDPRSILQNELGIVDGVDLDFAGLDIGDCLVTWHGCITPSLSLSVPPLRRNGDSGGCPSKRPV